MSALAALLRTLVVDPRSRRAIDETLLDATEEISLAKGTSARWCATGRAGVALSRVCLLSLGRELRHLHLIRVFTVLVSTFSVPVVLTVLSSVPWARSTGPRTILFLLLTSGAIAAFFPVSAFITGIAAARWRASLLGLAVVLVSAELALLGWITPEAYQQYRQRIYSAQRTEAMPPEIPRDVNELTFPQLFQAAAVGHEPRRARQQLSVRVTFCMATLWFVCLGYGAMRLSQRARITWAIAGAATIVSVGYFRFSDFTPLIAFGLALTLAIVRAHRDPAAA